MVHLKAMLILALASASLALAGPAKAVSLDSGFGDGGTVITQTGNPPIKPWLDRDYTGNVWAITEDPQGRILAGGGTGSKSLVIRYMPDGSLDPTFGDNGRVVFPPSIRPDDPSRTANRIRAISVLRSGKILLAGEETSLKAPAVYSPEQYFLRLKPDGSPDLTFANFPNYFDGPPPLIAIGGVSKVRDMIVQPDSKILTAGAFTDSVNTFNRRFAYVSRRDGELSPTTNRLEFDRTFAPKTRFGWGTREIMPAKKPYYNQISQMKLLGSGKILVGGNLRNRFFVGRLTKSGQWDRSFGKARNGRVISEIKNDKGKNCFCAVGSGMDRDRKGRIVLTGWSFPDRTQQTLNLLRYTPGGRPDRSFGRGGKTRLKVNQWISVRRVAVHPSGKIFVAAWLGLKEAQKFAVFAFKPNGKPLRSFFKKGRYIDPIGETSTAEDILIDKQGRLVVSGGTFKDGDASFVIKRFRVG